MLSQCDIFACRQMRYTAPRCEIVGTGVPDGPYRTDPRQPPRPPCVKGAGAAGDWGIVWRMECIFQSLRLFAAQKSTSLFKGGFYPPQILHNPTGGRLPPLRNRRKIPVAAPCLPLTREVSPQVTEGEKILHGSSRTPTPTSSPPNPHKTLASLVREVSA